MSTDLEERVAVLETLVEVQAEDHMQILLAFKEHMEKEDRRWEKIEESLARQKGFVGGIIFIISSLWAVALAGIHFLGK